MLHERTSKQEKVALFRIPLYSWAECSPKAHGIIDKFMNFFSTHARSKAIQNQIQIQQAGKTVAIQNISFRLGEESLFLKLKIRYIRF